MGHRAGHRRPPPGQLHRVPGQRAVRPAAHASARWWPASATPKIYGRPPRRPPSAPTATAYATPSRCRPRCRVPTTGHRREQRVAGTVVAHFSGTGTLASAVWDGRDTAGRRVPDGDLHAPASGRRAPTGPLDRRACRCASTRWPDDHGTHVAPGVISPNGDHFADVARVTFGVSEAVQGEPDRARREGRRRCAPWRPCGTDRRRDGCLGRQGEFAGDALRRRPTVSTAWSYGRSTWPATSPRRKRTVTVDDTLGHPRGRAGVAVAQRRRCRRHCARVVSHGAHGAHQAWCSPGRAARSCAASRSAAWRAGGTRGGGTAERGRRGGRRRHATAARSRP